MMQVSKLRKFHRRNNLQHQLTPITDTHNHVGNFLAKNSKEQDSTGIVTQRAFVK